MHRLVIENIPTELYTQLNQSAIIHGRPIEGEAIAWLKQAFRLQRVNSDAFLKRVAILNEKIRLPHLTDGFLEQAKMDGRPFNKLIAQ